MINIPCQDNSFFPEPEDNWKTPFILSLVVHLFILLPALLPATLFESNLHLEEIYSVDLFEVMDNGNVRKIPPATPAQETRVEKQPSKPPVTPEVSVTPASEIISTTQVPEEIISLTPRLRKKKLRKEKSVTKKEEKKLTAALEKIKSEIHRQQAAAEAERVKAAADAAVNDALVQLRSSIRNSSLPTNSNSGIGNAGGKGGQTGAGTRVMDAALKQYYIAVSQHIHRYWILPELQDWAKNLTAVYVVHVQRNGIVSKNYFETKSKDYYFNQFVEKTMKEALPLPPFPAGLKEQELEIGLIFHPSGLE